MRLSAGPSYASNSMCSQLLRWSLTVLVMLAAAGLLAAHAYAPAAGWLVVACDLPLVDASLLKELVAHRDAGRPATAFRASTDGEPEPLCAIYEPALLAQLAKQARMFACVSPT